MSVVTEHRPEDAGIRGVRGGDALAASLAAHGVELVFGIPGTHNLSVYAALRQHGITAISPRHEQGAGYAADGYARVSGRPGVCLTTTGPAALNAAAAAAQAQSDSVPVLFLAPGMPSRHPGRGNGLLHEVIDQRAAFAGVVEHTHRVTSVEEIPAAIAEAFAAMTSGRPRPAYVEIPLDVLETEGDPRPCPPLPRPAVAPAEDAVAAAVALLAGAQAPVIVAGGGASGAPAELQALAELIGAPVVMTANGKGVLAEDHPLAVGSGLHHPSVARLAAECDVLLAIGTELAPADLWYGPLTVSGAVVRIDIDPHRMLANLRPDVALVADAALALGTLADRLDARPAASGLAHPDGPDGPSGPNRVERGHARAAEARATFCAEARAEGAPYLGLAAALDEVLGRDGVIAGDSTMACYYGVLSNTRRHRPRSLLYPTGGGTLGYGLPAGIGAKLADPSRPVVVVHGDGGLMFSLAELAGAAELGLALPVVVVDNGGYGEIRNEMRDRQEDVHAVDLGAPDFPAVAEALGCFGREADDTTLAEALRAALQADRPTLIHVRQEA